MTKLYTYKAKCVRVLDGDTLELLVDLGFRMFKQDIFRLSGINTPELRSPDPEVRTAALKAKNRVLELLRPDLEVTVSVQKDSEKYGRWLATLVMPQNCPIMVNGQQQGETNVLNDLLVREGLAKTYP